jgi:hypothetical protein
MPAEGRPARCEVVRWAIRKVACWVVVPGRGVGLDGREEAENRRMVLVADLREVTRDVAREATRDVIREVVVTRSAYGRGSTSSWAPTKVGIERRAVRAYRARRRDGDVVGVHVGAENRRLRELVLQLEAERDRMWDQIARLQAELREAQQERAGCGCNAPTVENSDQSSMAEPSSAGAGRRPSRAERRRLDRKRARE